MGDIKPVKYVKFFVGFLFVDQKIIERAWKILEEKYGKIDKKSKVWPFSYTNYYVKEMGDGIMKQFISFESLIDPIDSIEIKHYTNALEKQLAKEFPISQRPINIDPGYLSLSKVVLTTTKDYNHRLYLGDGIYGEVTLHYQKKKFTPWDWTYPDYKSISYLQYFEELRNIYKNQLEE